MEDHVVNSSDLARIVIYIFIVFIILVGVLIFFFYFSRKKIIQKELEKKNIQINHQKILLQSIILTQESERKRIAQDLHDDISSKLNVVSLNAHLLTKENISDIQKNEITSNIIDLTTKALESSRSIAHDLSPPVLEKFGLHAGIQELVSEYNSTQKIKVTYFNELDFTIISQDNQSHIFRILQELLNNSIKHGKAKNAIILFKKINNSNVLSYIDDGVGFDFNNTHSKKGLGLSNIESRVGFLEGKLKINSKENEGIQVTFNFKNYNEKN